MAVSSDPTRSGSVGGASDEAGGQYRRGVAALFVAYGLNGTPFLGLPMGDADAIVEAVALETDFPVDDLLVELRGGRLFVQAKRMLKFDRTMSEVTDQWLRAVRDPRFRPAEDIVAAVAGDSSGPVRDAAEALDRSRRGVTVLAARHSQALNRVGDSLRRHGAQDDEVELICSRAVILSIQAESVEHEHCERGRLLLDGHVAQKGQGARAWRELLLTVGDAARTRVGHRVAGWLEWLRRREVPLTADAVASRAAYLEARHRAVARYRERLEHRGSHVDLTSIGLRVPPIPLSDMDASIEVREPEGDERDSHDLFWSCRLLGRVVLTGLPGSGKSAAVARVVSEWARRDGWSLPMLVSLRQVAEKDRFRKRPLRDEILNLAVELVDSTDRALVREALDEALNTGQAALFLDGLDEAADRSLSLVSDVVQLLEEAHPDTDVLLTTRDVAYADARILGFRDLRLCRPRDAHRTVRVVLQAIASHDGRAGADQWVLERVEWVRQLMRTDSQLGETPLLPVLLSSLAANYEADELPRTRSRILEQVVRNVVTQREIKREIRISGVPHGHEEEVAFRVFPRIATALKEAGGSARRSDLVEPVGEYLRHEWGLRPAVADATAGQLLLFWDEAGILVASGPAKTVSPRLQLFLEIGEALEAASRLPGDAVSWVEDTAVRDDRGESLVLSAGMSHVIADAVIDCATRGHGVREDEIALEAAQALVEGGEASGNRLRKLIKRLVSIVRHGDADAWRATAYAVSLPVPPDLQELILDTVRLHLPTEHCAVAAALASLEWRWRVDLRDEALEGLLRAQRPTRLAGQSLFGGRGSMHATGVFNQVLVRAAAILLPTRPDLVPVVAEASRHAGSRAAGELRVLLFRNGYRDVAMELYESFYRSSLSEVMTRSFRRMDKDHDDVLRLLVQLAPHAELSLSQGRRLSELASLVETLNLNDLSAWLSEKEWRVLRRDWINLIATLGGFDKGIIAAQAAVVEREQAFEPGRHSPFVDLYAFARAAELSQWDRVSDVEGPRSLLLRVLHGRRGSAMVAARALAEHPDAKGTAEALRSTWDTLPRESVVFAVWSYLELMEGGRERVASLAHSRNENVREAVARVDSLVEAGRPTSVGVRLAKDDVRQVRLAVVEQMEDAAGREAGEEILRLLEQMKALEDPPYTCYHCEAKCGADQDSCPSCRVVTQRPSVAAGASLKRLRRKRAGATK